MNRFEYQNIPCPFLYLKKMKPIIVAIITICFTTLFTCCKENPTIDPPQIKIYSEWTNYYDKDNFETHYTINSLTADSNNDIFFSAFIRRNNFSTDSTWVYQLHDKKIIPIDSSAFFLIMFQYH